MRILCIWWALTASARNCISSAKKPTAQFQKMKLDYYYNDPDNPERIYFRSDHWNYAKHGIPMIFYFDGTSVDYHRPTDTMDKIDFTK